MINNDCYKAAVKMAGNPQGIVVHSTGCNNKTLKRYVQPVQGQEHYSEIISDLGVNKYGNSWNNPPEKVGSYACVHAMIGVNAKGVVETYQTLPYDFCCRGSGTGSKGSYNSNPQAHLQFEICEDALNDENYFNLAMKEAQEYCAYLCSQFAIPVSKICSHKEAYQQGFGSAHVDPNHWLEKFGKNMNWFRDEVAKLLEPQKNIYMVIAGFYDTQSKADISAKKLTDNGFSPLIQRGLIQ